MDSDVEFGTEFPEVADGGEMDVSGVVPGVGQGVGDRHSATEKELCPGAEVAEIDEADNDFFADPVHFAEEEVGVVDGLKGLAEDDEIKGFVLEREVAVEVAVNDGHAVGDAFHYFILIAFETEPAALFFE